MKIDTPEIVQFQYLLPVQGNFRTLELIESISNKIQLSSEQSVDKEKNGNIEIKFTDEEIKFLKEAINILDSQGRLNFQALSLIKKIKGL
jgi:hypothetical protein